MSELEPIGHQLVIVTLVFGVASLATLSIRIGFRVRTRKYDVSDTCLVAAMVGLLPSDDLTVSLTASTDMWHHTECNSDCARRCVRLRKSKD